jgi:hypothetical protein
MREVFRRAQWALVIVLVAFGFAGPVAAAPPKTIANGLHGAIGAALDETNKRLYFVEYATGWLKYLELTPVCLAPTTPAMCPIHNVASGFMTPEDVALDVDSGVAYVTTRSVPGTGALYRVNLATGAKTLVTFNLGAPQQLVLRARAGKAFTVGYDDGRLRQIDLGTGAKKALATGLDHPVGIVVTADNALAYVTEQGATNAISRITLGTGVKTPVLAGLTAPFFLAWADEAGASIYLAERDPANRVSRVDLATGVKTVTFPALPARPSAVAVGSGGATLFITTDAQIVLGNLGLDPDPLVHPDFMGIGLISVSEIDADGRANSFDRYYKNAPFGGTLQIFANLTHFKRDLHHGYYKLKVAKNGAAPEPITLAWSTQRWDATPPSPRYKWVTIAPLTGTDAYEIPAEYGTGDAAWWYPPYLIVKYPTAEDGTYDFTLTLHDSPMGAQVGTFTKRILVDNTPPTVEIHNIYQQQTTPCTTPSCQQEVFPCDIVSSSDPSHRFTSSNDFTYKITAHDTGGHLLNYGLYAMHGCNCTAGIESDTYNAHAVALPPLLPGGPPRYTPILWPGVSTKRTSPNALPCNCAYTVYLYAWGRTTNGYGYLQYVDYHKSFTLNQPAPFPRCSATGCP